MKIEEKINKHLNEKDRMYGDGIVYGKITVEFSIDTGNTSNKYSIADKFAAKIERMKVKNIDDISVSSVDVDV